MACLIARSLRALPGEATPSMVVGEFEQCSFSLFDAADFDMLFLRAFRRLLLVAFYEISKYQGSLEELYTCKDMQ